MASEKLQEVYEFLKTAEGREKFFTLVEQDESEMEFDTFIGESDSSKFISDISGLSGCRIYFQNSKIMISYTETQSHIRLYEYGHIPDKYGFMYDKERDQYYRRD